MAASIGNQNALIVYKRLLDITRTECLKVQAHKYLFFYEQIIPGDWPESDFDFFIQPQGDLGQKMKNSLELVLVDHDKAVIIGSDCPEISKDIIEQAFDHLEEHDFVIGPSRDGGYYLLGLKNTNVDVFSNIPWSTAQVLPLTIHRINNAGHKFKLLGELSDIDLLEDLHEYPDLYEGLDLD